ncbi:M57 family metalloprotease [Pedobacter frigiditerrae]|uniref:M57 family metalloprotease n=1 Tax=Pedobacter frigiditerrae TaxID=2530452 RepID=UPI00292CEB5D|nr:M57 family metalloprotease [Pedobacter frigiditerrae]
MKAKLLAAGFDLSQGFSKYGDKYIVEYDIILSVEEIDNLSKEKNIVDLFKKGNDEKLNNDIIGSKGKTSHFVGNNLLTISSSVRTIYIYIPSSFGANIENALDDAISRYNALDLSLVFSRTTNSGAADIVISPASSVGYLMYAGFPTNGNPHNQILVNTAFYNSTSTRADAATAFAHEIGHCIGFRHTDYMDRTFSCGIEPDSPNEGSGTRGANHVTGTPTNPSYGGANNSWMLACSDGSDRPFIESDIISLLEVYPRKKTIYVKNVWDFVSDNGYYDTYNDYEDISWDVTVELYSDAALTIPYTTTNYLLLCVYDETEYYHIDSRKLVPIGVSSYHLGIYNRKRNYSYGTLIADNSSGFQLNGGAGYHGPYPFP